MARMSIAGFACALILCASGAEPARPAADAKAAFERLKTLAGDWTAKIGGQGQPAKVQYRVTAAGSVLMETQFPGAPHEMITMYHLDGDDLRLTHYCAAKNQPRLKLDRAASTADTLVFAFDGGTNFDPSKDTHMHSAEIRFEGPGHVVSRWASYQGGKKGPEAVFDLSKP
jgi:hypothetical protein